jgi:hypothetical protein
VEVPTDVIVRHIPRCVDYYAQGLGLKALQDLDAGCGCCAPELDNVSPDGFEDGFVEKELPYGTHKYTLGQKTQSVPHRKHITSPLQCPTG